MSDKMTDKPQIGWIGLGKMGMPMSQNLIKAGYRLITYDIDRASMERMAGVGATFADSPQGLAEECDVAVSMIPDDSALEEVFLGTRGVLRGARRGTVLIDMSTVSPGISSRVGEQVDKAGLQYLRAPVSGSTDAARAASLTILVSGSREAYERCRPVFECMGQKIFYVGRKEEARYLKLLINMMVGITSAMTAEALAFGKKGGLEWEQMIDMINGSVVASPLIGFKVKLLKDRRYPPMFTVSQMAKDFDLALNAGRTLDVPMPLTALVRQLYGAMKAQGKGELDYFGLAALMEEMSGMK
jgi:3-hydroxyisobutyrate dehydrogenase-like beta-hydroxyacid dehydrogenase